MAKLDGRLNILRGPALASVSELPVSWVTYALVATML